MNTFYSLACGTLLACHAMMAATNRHKSRAWRAVGFLAEFVAIALFGSCLILWAAIFCRVL